MNKYIVFYATTAEAVIASSPGNAKRISIEKNKKAGLTIAVMAVRPA